MHLFKKHRVELKREFTPELDLEKEVVDNPTVGILLCGSKDQSVARYSVLNGNEQLFASKYRLILPSEEELRFELQRDRQAIEEYKNLSIEDDSP